MAQKHTLTIDLQALVGPIVAGSDYLELTTNLSGGGVLMDKTNKVVHVPVGRIMFDPEGKASLELIDTSATDLNIEANTLQYRITGHATAADGYRKSKRVDTGWFAFTGDADLTELDLDLPGVTPSWRSQFAAQMEAVKDAATAATAADRAAVAADRAYVEGIVITDLGTTDGQTKALIESPTSETAAALNNAYGRRGHQQVSPSLYLYETLARQMRVLYHEGTTLYAHTIRTPRQFLKSTDGGTTWATQGSGVSDLRSLVRLRSGTLIGATTSATLIRSTDDGATWTTVHTLNFGPLTSQGLIETPSGYVIVGEYGNVGNTVYRVMRSTDDGITWAAVLQSEGTDPPADPGHFHSVTYDKWAGKLVAYRDQIKGHIFASADEGTTWVDLGEVAEEYMPNFVAPMFFQDYVAWGYDNLRGGVISRIKREDFYAGDWSRSNIEDVFMAANKVFYGTFPLDDDTWLATGALETIGGIDASTGHSTSEVFIVTENGSRVTSAFEWSHADVRPRSSGALRATFPAYKWDEYDHERFSWLAVNMSSIGSDVMSIPYTIGDQPPTQRPAGWFGPLLVNNLPLKARGSDGAPRDILAYTPTNRTHLRNSQAATMPEVVLYENPNGMGGLLIGGTQILTWGPEGIQMRGNLIEMGTSGSSPAIMFTGANPNGVRSARQGSLCLSASAATGPALWVKRVGTDDQGWVPANQPHNATSAQLLDKDHAINTLGKGLGVMVWDTTLGKPLWAAGSGATAVWRDATGANVHTPS